MKCGKDFDAVERRDDMPFDLPEGGAFTPQGTPDDSFPRAHAGMEAKPRIAQVVAVPVADPDGGILGLEYSEASESHDGSLDDEPPEINQVDVRSGVTDRHAICDRCGVANPHEQRFCKNCGASLGDVAAARRELEHRGPRMAGSWGYGDGPVADACEDDAFDADAEYQYPEEPEPTHLAMDDSTLAVLEPATLTDITSTSDFYADREVRPEPKRTRARRSAGHEWGVREWGIVVAASIVAVAAGWFFLFGGMNMFSGKVRAIKRAGASMAKLGSFEYRIAGSMESSQAGDFAGSGTLRFEQPDRSSWIFTTGLPGQAPTSVQQLALNGKDYATGPRGWEEIDGGKTSFDARTLWSNFSSVEDLGLESVGTTDCYHYRYRIAPDSLAGLFGISEQDSMADAVIEAWIDSQTGQIPRMTAKLYNLQVQGFRASALMDLTLASSGQQYNITAPF